MVLVAAVVRIVQTRGMAAPVVLCDEFIYANLAKNLADHGHYLFRDVTLHQSLLYPLLLAPAWFADSMGTTYALAKGITASAMALTAVPVVPLGAAARSAWHALLAAALTLLLPAFFFSEILMTEAVFLPAFRPGRFAIAYMLERPTLLAQLGAFAAIGLADRSRVQGIVLLLVIPTAVLLKVVFDWRAGVTRDRARRHGSAASGRPQPLLARRRRALRLLQARRDAERRSRAASAPTARSPRLTTRSSRLRAGRSSIWPSSVSCSGSCPMSALIVLLWLGLRRAPTTAAERAFLAVVPAALLWVLVETGAFAATTTPALFERYTFYLEPLLLLAFVVWLARGLPRPAIGTAVALGVPARSCSLSLDARWPRTRSTASRSRRLPVHDPSSGRDRRAQLSSLFGVVLGGFLFAICARPIARIALPCLLGVYFGVAGLDGHANRSLRGRAICGQRPELGRACRRPR